VYKEIYQDTVVYVPLFDTELFADKIEKLLKDPLCAKKYAEEGKKLVLQKYSPEIVIEKIERVLEKVTSGQRLYN